MHVWEYLKQRVSFNVVKSLISGSVKGCESFRKCLRLRALSGRYMPAQDSFFIIAQSCPENAALRGQSVNETSFSAF